VIPLKLGGAGAVEFDARQDCICIEASGLLADWVVSPHLQVGWNRAEELWKNIYG
jgi:hypothetical protein